MMPVAKKKPSVLNKINTFSSKHRGLVIILAFAIVGGAIMVFRSFAATGNSTYTVDNKTLTAGINSTYGKESKKNNAGIINMKIATSAAYRGGIAIVGNQNTGIVANQKFRLCTTINNLGAGIAANNNLPLRISFSNTRNSPVTQKALSDVKYNADLGNGYIEYCTQELASARFLQGSVDVENWSDHWIAMSSFTIKHYEDSNTVTKICLLSECL